MIYEFVRPDVVAEEIEQNLERHYEDADFRDDYGRPDIDWEAYASLSLMGKCGVVTAREDGQLIGYAVFVIGNDLNHKSQIVASNTGFFIHKSHRGKIVDKFLNEAERFLKGYGVTKTTYMLTDNRLGRLLRRKGFNSKFTIWSK